MADISCGQYVLFAGRNVKKWMHLKWKRSYVSSFGERNKEQDCQASQQTKYVICFKKENHSCCLSFLILLRYVQLTVFPKQCCVLFFGEWKAKKSLALSEGHPWNTVSLKSLSLKAAGYTCGHKIMEWGVRIPQRHLGPTSYLVLISFILALGH